MVQHFKAVAAEIWGAKIIEAAVDLAAVTWVAAALVKAVAALGRVAAALGRVVVALVKAAAALVAKVDLVMAIMACN